MIPDNSFWLWTALFAIVAASQWLERTRFGRRLSAPAFAITLGMLLSNLKILPSTSASYDLIGAYVVPVAIPLLLLDGDLRRILRESGVTLHAFALGTLCTIVAAVIAFALVPLEPRLGAQLAGAFAATYIGGSMNLVAVGQAVGMPDAAFAAAVAADNIVGSLYIALLTTFFSLRIVRRFFPDGEPAATGGPATAADLPAPPTLTLASAAGGLTLALAIAAVATTTARSFGAGYAAVLISTALTVAIATFLPGVARRFTGAFELGLLGMMVFFVTVGAGARIDLLVAQGVPILLFSFLVVSLHLLLLLPLAALFRLPLRETLIGSCSNVTGPAVSAAICATKGWRDLVVPGVLTGILGYVIGTFIGLALTKLLS